MREREKKGICNWMTCVVFDVYQKKPAEGSRLHFAFDI